MPIKADGERSRQRIVAGKRLASTVNMLGVPSLTQVRDGFTIKATHVDRGLDSVLIRAPMGAVVACSQDTGTQLVVADYWASTFDKVRDAYVITYVEGLVGTDNMYGAVYNSAVSNAKFVPSVTSTAYGSGTDIDTYADTPPTPSISAFVGEAYWVGLTGRVTAHSAHVYESRLNFYSASGEEPKRICVFADAKVAVAGAPYSVQNVTAVSMRQVAHLLGDYWFWFDDPDNKLMCALAMLGQPDGLGYAPFLGSTMFSGAPTGLQTLMLKYPGNDTQAIGSYAYALSSTVQPTLLHCVDTTDTLGFGSYYGSNPSHEPWKLFFSIYTLGAGTISTWTVDTALLHTLSPVPVVTAGIVNWNAARDMIWQFFPWPNNNRTVASDSAMFHDGAGAVYAWTRKYGTMRFSTGGMAVVTVVVPALVSSTDGVRPEIYRVSTGLYVCIAYQPGHLTDPPDPDDHIGVRGVFFGSPFSAWSAYPGPPAGYRLLHVRCVEVSSELSVLLGVLTDDAGGYFFARLRYDHVLAEGDWLKLGELPITVADVDRANWAVGVFGDDALVSSMMAGSAHPPCLPQMAIAPYEKYAGMIP